MTDRKIVAAIRQSDTGSIFLEARERAEQEWSDQQRLAVRVIAGQSRDVTDFTALLSMLDLGDPALRPAPLGRRLAAYVRQVAVAVGVAPEATGYDVSDPATAYLGLDQRCAERPDHDLRLVWDERLGWYIALETTPITETPTVIAYLDGDVVPPPAAIARFVAEAAAGRGGSRFRPVQALTERAVLAGKLTAACETGR